MSRGTTLLLRGLPPATRTSKKARPSKGSRWGRYHPSSPAGLLRPIRLGALSRCNGRSRTGLSPQSFAPGCGLARWLRGEFEAATLPRFHQDAGSLVRIGCSTPPRRRLCRLETCTVDFRRGRSASQGRTFYGSGSVRPLAWKARAKKLTPQQRSEIAKRAARPRWSQD